MSEAKMAAQLDIFIAERASHDERVAQIVRLADRILSDEPELELSHLAAELCRAAAGVGEYALPQRQPADPARQPHKGRQGSKGRQAGQGSQ